MIKALFYIQVFVIWDLVFVICPLSKRQSDTEEYHFLVNNLISCLWMQILSGIFRFVHTVPVHSDQRGAFLSSCTTLPVLILLYDSGLVLFCSWLSIQCKCCTVVNHAVISFAIENHLLHRYYFFNICHMAFYDMSVSCAIC